MTPSPLRLPRPSAGGGYAVAVLVVALAVAAARLFADILDTNPIVSLLLCGIMFVAWFAGIGPAWLAAGLSVLAFDYYFVPPIYSLYVPVKDVPRVILLAAAAGFVVLLSAAHRSAAASLRRARDNLQLAVADLEQTNKALQRAEQEVRLGEQNLPELCSKHTLGSMSGVDLQGELLRQGYRIPIIFITAFPEDRVRDQVLEAGAICYLIKPFRGRAIIDCLRNALDKPLSEASV